jgi:adenosylcobinamide-phosphate synthase
VRLRKPGVYVLNQHARSPDAPDLERALHVAARAAWAGIVLAVLVCFARELVR